MKDSLIDNILIVTGKHQPWFKVVTKIKEPKELIILAGSLQCFIYNDLLYVASSVRFKVDCDINGTGFIYPTTQIDPDEEPLEGVLVYNPLGEVQISIPTFEHLMLRCFRTIISETEKQHHIILSKHWWNKFVETTEAIGERTQI